MTAVLVEHSSAGFSNGNAGHVIAYSGGPTAGQLDVITANSNTVISTPSGFTLARSRVNSQGSYIWYRLATGGESANITITTNGDHSTAVTWSRWDNGVALDVAADNGVDSSSGLATPAVSTAALAEADELVVVLAALHNLSTGVVPSSPVWSSGYTALESASDVTGPGGDGAHVAALVGYRTDAGTAAESPSVTWTSPAGDRYALVATFTTSPLEPVDTAVGAGAPIAARTITATVTSQTVSRTFTDRTRGGVL